MLTGSRAQCEIQNLVRSVRKKAFLLFFFFFKHLVCEAAAGGAAAAMARARRCALHSSGAETLCSAELWEVKRKHGRPLCRARCLESLAHFLPGDETLPLYVLNFSFFRSRLRRFSIIWKFNMTLQLHYSFSEKVFDF